MNPSPAVFSLSPSDGERVGVRGSWAGLKGEGFRSLPGGRTYLPSVMLDGKPFSQLLGESHGRAERLSDSVVAQPLAPQAAAASSKAKNQ
jgi:hypothetical protein